MRIRSSDGAPDLGHLDGILKVSARSCVATRTSIAADFRDQLEWTYGCSLRDVEVRVINARRQLGRPIDNVCAWALCDRVDVSAAALTSSLPRLVLAHELAHVAQKRLARAAERVLSGRLLNRRATRVRSTTVSQTCALELEAAEASLSALAGVRRPIRIADANATPRAWGPAGHYYTTVLVAYAAGMSAERAQRLGFFCQMPDQVEEYDAAVVGRKLLKCVYEASERQARASLTPSTPGSTLSTTMRRIARPIAQVSQLQTLLPSLVVAKRDTLVRLDAALTNTAMFGSSMSSKDLLALLDIQIGLHSLSGGPAEDETSFRRRILETFQHRTGWESDLALGLAVHAFGDSFAHRNFSDPTRMYSWGLGHAIEAPFQAHDPDNISNARRVDLYVRYVREMYQAFRRRYTELGAKLSELELTDIAHAVVKITSERHQCAFIAGRVAERGGRVDTRWMFEEMNPTLSMEKFGPKEPRVTKNTNDHVQQLAREWRMMPRPAGKSFASTKSG